MIVLCALFLCYVGCVGAYGIWIKHSVEILAKDELVVGISAAQVEAALKKRGLDFIYDEKHLSYHARTSFRPPLGGVTTIYMVTVQMNETGNLVSCTVTHRLLI